MSAPLPHPQPDILSLVQACNEQLARTRSDEFERAFSPPQRGSLAAEPTTEQLESVYRTACRLCDDGSFRFAAALALHLATYKPGEPRYAFLAGTCMQRMDMPSSAARFFCFALINGGDHPATLFRLGECLLALGDNLNADRAFDAALDVSRAIEGAEELQYQAQRMIGIIQSDSRSTS